MVAGAFPDRPIDNEYTIESMGAVPLGPTYFGKEAAEAVLDVAGEYDFSAIDQSDEGKLKSSVLDILATSNDQRIDPIVSGWLTIPHQARFRSLP